MTVDCNNNGLEILPLREATIEILQKHYEDSTYYPKASLFQELYATKHHVEAWPNSMISTVFALRPISAASIKCNVTLQVMISFLACFKGVVRDSMEPDF